MTDRLTVMQAICEQVGRGDLVKDACRAQSTTRQTLHRWMAEQTDEAAQLRDLYARARSDQAHAIAEDAMMIADEPADTKEEVARNRLRVDTRKWLASKIAPRDYGDRIEQAHSGGVTVSVVYSNE